MDRRGGKVDLCSDACEIGLKVGGEVTSGVANNGPEIGSVSSQLRTAKVGEARKVFVQIASGISD